MNITPLSSYIPNGSITGMSKDDWGVYRAFPITELPESQVEKVANALTSATVREEVGSTTFNRIFIYIPTKCSWC